jgi:hypothetical protein
MDVLPYSSTGSYHWSNGVSGSSVFVEHGGAYRVYYIDNHGCMAESSSVQVPHSPEYYLWTFPIGCYYFCQQEVPVYVYGPAEFPLDAPYQWQWWHDGHVMASGTAPSYNDFGLDPPLEIVKEGVYQVVLSDGLCTVTSGNMNVSVVPCEPCALKIDFKDNYCWDNMTPIDFHISNPTGGILNYSIQDMTNMGITIYSPAGLLQPGGNIVHIDIAANSSPPVYVVLELIVWDLCHPDKRCYYYIKFAIIDCSKRGYKSEKSVLQSDNRAISLDYFYLYPNPAGDNCTVAYRFSEAGNYQITLRDMAGKELHRTTLTELSGQLPVDLSSYCGGLYLIECKKENALVRVLKVIKK